MQLSKNFSLEEMVRSDIAMRFGIENKPGEIEIANLRAVANLMEQVRWILLNQPIVVHSGYRCLALNERVGGSKTSVHMLGLACDFTCPDYGTPYQIAERIQQMKSKLPTFDQCILEYGWVHIGLPRPSSLARSEFLTKKSATAPYEPGLVV